MKKFKIKVVVYANIGGQQYEQYTPWYHETNWNQAACVRSAMSAKKDAREDEDMEKKYGTFGFYIKRRRKKYGKFDMMTPELITRIVLWW